MRPPEEGKGYPEYGRHGKEIRAAQPELQRALYDGEEQGCYERMQQVVREVEGKERSIELVAILRSEHIADACKR